MVISRLYERHSYLLESPKISDFNKNYFKCLADTVKGNPTIAQIKSSLAQLSNMMQAHFDKQVILLIDEYDVPLAKANDNNYYTDMLNLIRGILSPALKRIRH